MMQDFVTIIQSVGFPIAVAIAMFVMLQNEQKRHKEESQQLMETMSNMKISFDEAMHTQEINITTAINNNTIVIQKLIDKLDKEVK